MDYPRFDPASAVTPLSADELDTLDTLLQKMPTDAAMSLDGLDGYLTALIVGPAAPLTEWPTADWLPLAWGGDGPRGMAEAAPFATMRQRKNAVVLVLRHLRHLSHLLNHTPADWEPIFNVADDGAEERVDARDWCAGFLQAVDLQPEAWGAAWQDENLRPVLTLGGGLEGSLLEPAEPGDPAIEVAGDDLLALDAMGRAVPDAVLTLLEQRRTAKAAQP